ncbi:MAG: peptidase S9 [Ignavibacteria bacterium GWF2_33_9]|nr:MAG: peptidase S9 [Ignavibacteria bacterium GWF2_33_9]
MKRLVFYFLVLINSFAFAQNEEMDFLSKQIEALNHRLDVLEKKTDDNLWYQRVGDKAFIDKVYITGPPRWKVDNPNAMGANNPLKFWSYIFIPKGLDLSKKYPLIVLPHGGVHADFTTYHTHIIKELLYQKYIIVCPEYRGSTGYGQGYYNNIDYGGLEVDDCDAARQYMIDNYDFINKNKVGIVGWSHGGLIAFMSGSKFSKNYAAVYAGVPVSDLVMRMGYYDDEYRDLYSSPHHIGETAMDNLEEYKKRSPVWNVKDFDCPLLIHTNTNDDDVNYIEVEHLIQALKAENKKFEYEVFQDAPGGHSFNRIDIKNAREIRLKIYKFLNKNLNPDNPITNLDQIQKAAYIE